MKNRLKELRKKKKLTQVALQMQTGIEQALISKFENDAKVLSCLPLLKNCEAHISVIPSGVDAAYFRKLGMHLTYEPEYENNNLFHVGH